MIIIYSPYFYPEYIGGAERLAYYTALGFKKNKIKVSIITLGKVINHYIYEGIDVYVLPLITSEENKKEISIAELNFSLDYLQPVIIHIIGLIAVTNIIEYAARKNIPTSMAGMDYSIPCDNRTLIRGNQSVCSGRKNINDCFNCNLESGRKRDKILATIGKNSPNFLNTIFSDVGTKLLGRKFGSQLYFWESFKKREKVREILKNNLNIYIAPSKFTKDVVSNYFQKNKTEIFELMYPLSEEYLKDYKKKINKKQLIVGYIGRVIPIKGLEILLESIRLLDPDLSIYFKIYCPNNNDFVDYRLNLKNKFTKLENVDWNECGVLNADELKIIHSNLDILVVPSIWQEYLGFVTIEALSLGTPVILSDFESQSHFVQNTNNGKLFSTGNSVELSQVITDYYNRKIESGLPETEYKIPTVEEYAKELLEIYKKVI